MTPERWRQIEDIFHQAADLGPEARERLLARACGDDADLRERVLALLASDGAAAGFIEAQVQEVVVDLHAARTAIAGGKRIGAYRVTGVLGRGGMGTVYLAERADEEYQGEVAIKLVRADLDAEVFLSRFRRERQTLARLQHPHIARLLDSGTTEEGLPYIVMERIHGRPINVYCREERLSIEQILRLFLPVCAAVSHAHQNFVVHRDLKPGNILVDSSGAPKLLDFGICKWLFAGEAADMTMTESGCMLTPDYASPEQVRAEPITVASDVYSLGAVLYELLTGERPHRIRTVTPLAVEQAICHEEARRPSLVVAGKPVARHLAGDLDNILLKTLQKEPARRYESVEQLADDIRRYLEHRPISARPDTLHYRAKKYARRHRGAITAVAAVILTLAAGVIESARQVSLARHHLAQTRKLANAIVFDIYDQLREVPGALAARQSIVKLGLQYLDSLSQGARGDVQLLRELAAGYERMGEVQGNVLSSHMGDPEGALASYGKAMALLVQLPPSRQVQLDLALLYRRMGDVQSFTNRGREARRSYAEGLRVASALYQQHREDGECREMLAYLHEAMGRIDLSAEDRVPALASTGEALRLWLESLAKRPDDRNIQASIAALTSRVGTIEGGLNRLEAARDHLRDATSRWDRLCALEPMNVSYHRNRMLAYSHLGNVLGNPLYANLGDGEGARKAFLVMLAESEWGYRNNPSDQRAILDYGMALMHSAELSSGGLEERLRLLRRSEHLLGQVNRANAGNQVNLASVREQIGDLLSVAGQRKAAREAYRQGLATVEANRGAVQFAARRMVVTLCGKLAEDAARRREPEQALSYGKRAVAAGEEAGRERGAPVPQRALAPMSHAAMASVYELLDRKGDARRFREQAAKEFRELRDLPGFPPKYRDQMVRLEAVPRR